ncbi:MAG: efflux RND transporter periplasmic adaptor subunit, partial [Bdellovibrionales bacterium]|nr:efflux RND transporter periplasmic adaptor subunit [Bdellovibrionales bacterium]
ISPRVDLQTRTVLVKALVSNPNLRLKDGMFADVSAVSETRKAAVVIPETALIIGKGQSYVYVVGENNTATNRPVVVGERLPGEVEIVDGLSPGEMVITEGTQKIRPGAPVQPQTPEAPQSKVGSEGAA